MMRRPAIKRRLGGAIGIGAAFLIAGLLMAPQQVLEVYREGTHTPLMRLKAGRVREFSVWFLHSYDRAYFEEHYRLGEGGRILLSHMRFKSCLNGQGFDMGTYRPLPDGSAELAGINLEVDEIRFRLGSPDLADHTLIVGGRRFRLLDVAETGDLLCIRSIIKPAWQVLWGQP